MGLVTSMIQQTETNQPTTTGSEAPQDVQEKKSNSLIWQHYNHEKCTANWYSQQ